MIALWLLMPLFSGAQRAVVARDRGRRLSEPGNTCGLSIVLDILRLILILEICFFSGRRARVLRAEVPCPPSAPGRLGYNGDKGRWIEKAVMKK